MLLARLALLAPIALSAFDLVAPIAAYAQSIPPGRPLTTNDVAAGGINLTLDGTPEHPDGSHEAVRHIDFPAPMSFLPVITLTVTQIDVSTSNGRLAYSISDSQPTCRHPEAIDKQCTGFDLTVTAARGTDIKVINVAWLALNGLNPAIFANPTITITPK